MPFAFFDPHEQIPGTAPKGCYSKRGRGNISLRRRQHIGQVKHSIKSEVWQHKQRRYHIAAYHNYINADISHSRVLRKYGKK